MNPGPPGHAGSAAGEMFSGLARRLEARDPPMIPPEETGAHAAVALLLAHPGLSAETVPLVEGEEELPPTTEPSLPEPWHPVRALLILRRQVEGDPWAGHVALPGGKREADDLDLVDTARRETMEETGLVVARSDVLGRLPDLHPRSARLPDLAIRPFVARWRGEGRLELNHEVDAAFWVQLASLADPGRRSELQLERRAGRRRFPTIELGEHTVWGLTHAILEQFLAVLAEGDPPAG